MPILIATDLSPNSLGPLRFAADLARRSATALVVLHVVDIAASDNSWRILVETPDVIEKNAVRQANEELRDFYEQGVEPALRPAQVRFEVVLGSPIDAILDVAEAIGPSLLVAGTRGASRLQGMLLGSTANRLVRQAEVPVALVPPETRDAALRKIVVPVDFSPTSHAVLRYAAGLARRHGAALRVLHAYVLPDVAALRPPSATVARQLEQVVAGKHQQVLEYLSVVDLEGVEYTITILQEPPHMAILDFAASEEAELICMGTHGRRGFARFFLGNTAERVLRRSVCPIVTVRAPEDAT